jgi:nicotinamide-nucleotide amidase
MRAELVIVGSEMLRFGRRDTNADWLIEQLERLGIETSGRTLVRDDPARIAAAVRYAMEQAELIIITGGLGPTEDDRSRDGLAAALGLPLESDSEMLERLRLLLLSRGRPFGDNQAQQALRPRGAAWIDNPVGTAPGMILAHRDRLLAALPGVPEEMKPMFRAGLLPRLENSHGRAFHKRTLKVAGRTEPSVDEQMKDLYATPGVEVTILSGSEGIELHLVAELAESLERLEALMCERLGRDLYSRDDRTLPAVAGELLLELGKSLATAESCTAGMLAAAVTDIPGSSAWFRGGVVVYSDDLKIKLAGVREETLAARGAVSEEVARELAAGVRTCCGADYGIGITGVAGPGGGSEDKPVGLVHIALDDGEDAGHWRILQFGDRHLVRRRSVTAALDRLRRRLLDARDRRGAQ